MSKRAICARTFAGRGSMIVALAMVLAFPLGVTGADRLVLGEHLTSPG